METQYREYIGTLASVGDGDDRENVFVNKADYIQYRVKSLTLPEDGSDPVFGFMASFEDEEIMKEDEYDKDNDVEYAYDYEEERVERFRKNIEGKLFIYCKKKNEKGLTNMVPGKTNLVRKPLKFEENTKFYVIPVFCSKNNQYLCEWQEEKNWRLFREYENKEEFIEYLRKEENVGSLYGYDLDAFTPSFVIWMEEDGTMFAIGCIDQVHSVMQTGIAFECEKMACVNITEYYEYWVYQMSLNPTIMYLPENIYGKIEESLVKEENQIKDLRSQFVEETTLGNFVLNEEDQQKLFAFTKAKDIDAEEKPVSKEKTDAFILSAMEYYSQERDLFYNRKDFVNLHTALKCNSLVILSGLSGTGKSAIVDVYANALGIHEEKESRLLFVPVRPSWNDDSDLLGYVDLVHMEYRAGDSGFVDFLVRAQKEENKNKLFFVCFDEMNLARTEYYFSQFLSLLERPEEQRELQLYDKKYDNRLKNSGEYPYKIKIGNNIRFIGTVNIDETTHHFSDKVLDRANVIQLDVINYAKDWKKKNYSPLPDVKWSMEDYQAITIKNSSRDLQRVHELLWEIHTLLRSSSLKYGIGPRVVKDIDRYLCNLPEEKIGGLSYAEGIDLQIVQRVLTKVRGPENQLGKVLESTSERNLYQIFDEYKDLSKFSLCRETVDQKQRELEAYGYCI